MFPDLSTNRLLLTQVLPQDLDLLFEGLSDPVAMPYNGVYYDTPESVRTQLEWYEKNYREGSGTAWKITERSTGERLGVIGFYHYKSGHRKAEVGFWILPRYWNRGFTSEALLAVTDYCRLQKGIHRLEAIVEVENTASSRVLEKCGFAYEGTQRDAEIKFGKFISLRVYALIAPYADILPR